MLYV
jgi:hypothetical protein